jgi:hypothetical protein
LQFNKIGSDVEKTMKKLSKVEYDQNFHYKREAEETIFHHQIMMKRFDYGDE